MEKVRPGTGREAGLGHAGSGLLKLPVCLIVDFAGSDVPAGNNRPSPEKTQKPCKLPASFVTSSLFDLA
jgi:hypothetical protein